jgi:hypothetical protein
MRAFGASLAVAGVLFLGSAQDASGVSAVVWGATQGDWNDSYYPDLHRWWDPAEAAWYVGYVQFSLNTHVRNGGTVVIGSSPVACCQNLTVGGVDSDWDKVPVVGRQSTVQVNLLGGNPALAIDGTLAVGGEGGGQRC